jgi:hypothetical protein
VSDVKQRNGKGAGEEKETAANASDPPEPSSFERFEEFARKVVSVPKATIDERERAYRESRRNGKG